MKETFGSELRGGASLRGNCGISVDSYLPLLGRMSPQATCYTFGLGTPTDSNNFSKTPSSRQSISDKDTAILNYTQGLLEGHDTPFMCNTVSS
eukprot:2699507-Amphidinium_carterae.1